MRTSLLLAFALMCGACNSLDLTAPLGSTANPVRVDRFVGEFRYFSQLRCPDGTKPHVQRLLRRPPGPYGHALNGYRIRCIYLNAEHMVYFDPFHTEYAETEPVEGFSLADSPHHRVLDSFAR